MKIISNNKKAYHDYFILDTFEAGIELKGTEIKSIRLGNVNLKDSYVRIKNGEVEIINMHISPYEMGNIFNHEPTRNRKLLLHRKEIKKIENKLKEGASDDRCHQALLRELFESETGNRHCQREETLR